MEQHLVVANLVGGHVGRHLRAEGGIERRGKCDVLVSVGLTSVWVKTASTFPMSSPSCSYKA